MHCQECSPLPPDLEISQDPSSIPSHKAGAIERITTRIVLLTARPRDLQACEADCSSSSFVDVCCTMRARYRFSTLQFGSRGIEHASECLDLIGPAIAPWKPRLV